MNTCTGCILHYFNYLPIVIVATNSRMTCRYDEVIFARQTRNDRRYSGNSIDTIYLLLLRWVRVALGPACSEKGVNSISEQSYKQNDSKCGSIVAQ